MRRASCGLLISLVATMVVGCPDDGDGDSGDTATTGPSTTQTSGPTAGSTGEPTTGGSTGSSADESSGGSTSTTGSETGATTSGGSSESSGTTGGGGAAVLFLNMGGVELVDGAQEDATTNTTATPDLVGTWSAIDAGRAATVLAGVQALVGPFAIDVTDVRPAAGPYTMVVVGADPPPFPGAGGLALSDCDDANPNSIALVFDDPVADYSTQEVINIVGFQLGVTYGLNPVEGADTDIMTGALGEQARSFTQPCATETAAAACTPATATCDAGEQSSFEEMLARFGPA